MEVRILGAHHLETATSRLVSLLVDDTLALDAGSLSSSLSLAEQLRLKAILITHVHFDHAKDLPLIGLATAHVSTTEVYAPSSMLDFLSAHLFDGEIYPPFDRWPSPENPSLRLRPIEPLQEVGIDRYRVKAVPVRHASVFAVGYEVVSEDGRSLFYTGDTGPGLSSCWGHTSPHLLVVEVSLPDSWEQRARQVGHLTPGMLEQELVEFRWAKGYLPMIVAVHLNPALEGDITRGLEEVSRRLGATITVGRQGLRLRV